MSDFILGEVFAFDSEDAEPIRKSGGPLDFDIQDDIKADIEVPSAHDITSEALIEALESCDKIGKLRCEIFGFFLLSFPQNERKIF